MARWVIFEAVPTIFASLHVRGCRRLKWQRPHEAASYSYIYVVLRHD